MQIKIKDGTEKDIENVINACIAEGWGTFASRKEDFKKAISNSILIVAYDSDNFVGFTRAISDGYITTFLCELLIVKEYRNKGIGRMLVNHIMNVYPNTRLDLISEADGFYEKLTFRKVGTGYRISER